MNDIVEKLSYLAARVESLQKEADRLREASTEGDTQTLERVLDEIQRLKDDTQTARQQLEDSVNTLSDEVSRHRRLVTSVRAVLYVLAAVLTFRFGDVPQIVAKYWGS